MTVILTVVVLPCDGGCINDYSHPVGGLALGVDLMWSCSPCNSFIGHIDWDFWSRLHWPVASNLPEGQSARFRANWSLTLRWQSSNLKEITSYSILYWRTWTDLSTWHYYLWTRLYTNIQPEGYRARLHYDWPHWLTHIEQTAMCLQTFEMSHNLQKHDFRWKENLRQKMFNFLSRSI